MTPFFPFSWKELIDLFLISFLLHRLYLLFRGTTALQVVVGVFFMWLLYFAGERAGLVVTTRFFQAMAAVAVIGLVIVFRREIREVLLHTNPLRFFLGQGVSPIRLDLDEAASTAFRLAAKRTGCLICFQRRDNVEEFVEEGTELGGKFGGAIIESIFAKESPLHDGAVIVRHGRISRVGAFLPLTTEKNVPDKFGTRHRAALGLSELCDAVILVVSEERGEVSLVQRGTMEAVESPRILHQRLREALSRREAKRPRGGWSWEGPRQIIGLAVVFVMVTVLWNLYLGGGDSLTSMRIPVELRNVPENTEVTHDFQDYFMVRISGKNRLIESLRPGQVSAFIDLGNLPDGDHLLRMSESNIRLPPGLRVVQVEPAAVEVQLERRIERDLPVRVLFTGHRGDRATVSALIPQPGTMRVVGPRAEIERMTHLLTDPIPLDGLDAVERQEISISLAPLPPGVSLVDGVEHQIRVIVEMRL